MPSEITYYENTSLPLREKFAMEPFGVSSIVYVLSKCFYGFFGVKTLLRASMARKDAPGEILWCRSTIEIDYHKLRHSVNPVVVVVDYPGAETNWLLHQTLTMYFSKVIFLSRGLENSDGLFYHLSLNNSLDRVKQNLADLISLKDPLKKESHDDRYDVAEGFTSREAQFLILMKKGMDAKRIAQNMDVSISTVYSYRRSVCKKMGVKNIHGIIKELHKPSV